MAPSLGGCTIILGLKNVVAYHRRQSCPPGESTEQRAFVGPLQLRRLAKIRVEHQRHQRILSEVHSRVNTCTCGTANCAATFHALLRGIAESSTHSKELASTLQSRCPQGYPTLHARDAERWAANGRMCKQLRAITPADSNRGILALGGLKGVSGTHPTAGSDLTGGS